jgi:hypothetical protein
MTFYRLPDGRVVEVLENPAKRSHHKKCGPKCKSHHRHVIKHKVKHHAEEASDTSEKASATLAGPMRSSFSGRIPRRQRGDSGSIPGERTRRVQSVDSDALGLQPRERGARPRGRIEYFT